MTFHISDLKKFSRCPRLYLLEKDQRQESIPFLRLDQTVTDLAMKKLNITSCFLGERGDEPTKALFAMEENEWLVKARFEYHDLRIKVPFLHRVEQGWDLYFLFVGLYPLANDLSFYQDTVWVLEQNGISLNEIYIIHFNEEYVRKESLDEQELFVISDSLYNQNHHPTINLKEILQERKVDCDVLMDEMKEALNLPIPSAIRSSKCVHRTKCRQYESCFPEESNLPDNSILYLIGSQNRYEMKEEGRETLKMVDEERIEGFGQQYAQIMADQNGGFFYDQLALKSWLKTFQFPITFLDFEWERYALPPYQGMRPYDVLLFEYSIHILQEDGTVEHKSFLSIHDQREEFCKRLIQDIPSTGSIVAYNAFGAESLRIQELAQQFPIYESQLLPMVDRMIDLQMPFVSGIVYDTRMKGNWSLKAIMAMMNDPGYQDLDIQQGMDAVFQWRLLDKGLAVEEEETIKKDLEAYCSMDTYAMVVVYQWLCSLSLK